MEKNNFVIIDSHALIHRAFHAFPDSLRSSTGQPTNAVYGFTGLLIDVLLKFKPKRVVAVFDSKGPTIRHADFNQYKANRADSDDLLVMQFPLVHDLVRSFNIPILIQDGVEADDLIGTLDHLYSTTDYQTIVVTGDKDLLQLVDEDTFVYLAGSKFSESKLYKRENVIEKMGVPPELVPDYKGLSGDPSDNIPGVRGIGPKSAISLLTEFGTIENIYASIEQVNAKFKEKLINNYQEAIMSKKLATIYRDIPISFNIQDSKFESYSSQKISDTFQLLGFKSLLGRLPRLKEIYRDVDGDNNSDMDFWGVSELKETSQSPADTPSSIEWSNQLLKDNVFILCNLINANKSPINWDLDFMLAYSGESLFKVSKEKFIEFFNINKEAKFYSFNKKILFHLFKNLNSKEEVDFVDLGLYSFLLSEGKSKFDLDSALDWGLIKRGVSLESKVMALKDLNEFVFSKKDIVSKAQKLIDLEDSIMRLVFEMEQNGIALNLGQLREFETQFKEQLEILKQNIYQSAGHEFNIASPKQVSEVLFKEKSLFNGKKTKGGALSTNESVLKSLVGADPIIEYILKFRELDKIINTYLTALPDYVDKDKKIHSIFDQFGAVSGRFSSKNPNLQNIPKGVVEGVNIRNAFEASPGYSFISFDYSQQELRILAALSNEEVMIESFNKGIDIHKITASELFEVAIEDVTPEQRSVGKTINFSVIYGISAFGLSERLGVVRAQSQEFIDKYFAKYKKVKIFMDKIFEDSRKSGYSETVMGRKRFNSLISSSNRTLKNAAERELFNFVIQGSAADIMKVAMSDFYAINKKYNSKLILQIHDEFVFEFPEDSKNKSEFIKDVTDIMSSALNIGVRYEVGVSEGLKWGEI